MQGITPDLIVEPFIVLSTSYSDNPPLRVGISSHGYHQTSMKPCKIYNKLGLQHLYPLIVIY